MWNELSLPWQAAVEMAWEAACSGSLPIGAVIVDGQGNLVAAGRNRLKEPRTVGPLSLAGLPLAHAEINALLSFDYQAINPRECVLYTTTEPCPMCAGAAVMANVRHICYASRDPWAGSTNLYTLSPYMSKKPILVEGPPDPFLEAVLVALGVEFYLHEAVRRGSPDLLARHGPYFSSIEAAIPPGVALGERLYESGDLQRMRAERISAGEVIDALALALPGSQLLPQTGSENTPLGRELFTAPVRH
jgi:tRNA(adenine34) deaminase